MWKLKQLFSVGLLFLSGVVLTTEAWAQANITQTPVDETGLAVYAKYCASCHDKPEETKSPTLQALREMSARIISYALTNGKMRVQGDTMTAAEIDTVVGYLAAAQEVDRSWIAANTCTGDR